PQPLLPRVSRLSSNVELSGLGSLSNRASLVNDLLAAVYAGIRVVSAVGVKPPHDGRARVRLPEVLCAVRIGRNEPTRIASPTSRQGHRDSTSETYKHGELTGFSLCCGRVECEVERYAGLPHGGRTPPSCEQAQ